MTTGLPLWDALKSDAHAERQRVRANIGAHVVNFVADHEGREFHLSELTAYVTERSGCCPASPDRILRDLRTRGQLNYVVVSRSRSLYRALPNLTLAVLPSGEFVPCGSLAEAE